MKTKLLLYFLLIGFGVNAQLRLIKQTQNNGSKSPTINGVKTVDNDILLSMAEDFSPYSQSVFVSGGSSETTYKVSGLNNLIYRFTDISKKPNSKNNDVFLYDNTSNDNKIYRINNQRTQASLVASADNKSGLIRTSNNKIVKHSKVYYASYTENFKTYPAGYNFFIDIFNADGNLETSYTFDGNTGYYQNTEDNNSLTRIDDIFFWKGKYYFIGSNTQNRVDIYYFDNLRSYKITKLYVSGNSNFSVNPDSIILEEDYIYFRGLYRTWKVNDTEGNYEEHGREICYSDGSFTFGSNQTEIPLFFSSKPSETQVYDGSRGYRAKDTNTGYADSTPIKLVGGNLIYRDNTNKTLNLIASDNILHNLVSLTRDSDEYFFYNNKLYYFTYEIGTERVDYMYEFDGNPFNIKKYMIPANYTGHVFRVGLGIMFDVSKAENKVFIVGNYYEEFSKQTPAIISFDFATAQFSEEKTFDNNEVSNSLKNLKRFNNGFVFTDLDKAYSYNVEIRTKVITPNPNGNKNAIAKKNSEELTYNGISYNIDFSSSNLPANEKLKLQILDSTSFHFKTEINSLPDNSFAKTYYNITSLNDSAHESTLTISYNNADFLTPITKESDVSLQAFENGNWVDLGDFTVDLANKKITLAHNFKANSALFIKNSAVLNVDNFEISNANVTVFPNPSSSIINIQFKNNETIKSLEIYNIRGQKMDCKVDNKTDVIHIYNLSKGVYILKIKGEKANYSKRIIKN
ncbi:T9SS type A sorting domain-containing protein [Polaribacter haliotis]|uniref:T9SS type A sorting domain-containing protein n=1 Tax=Polaribacter haliotis TaxID=1888915 RepID=A0A7L8AD51_9FLAO|nr:T9SS type A sorting domain-containing protein [Polaribacter haliotis]QOD59948.1 T9SS type A sorting domain-containing protein [Polaribacter haliotis]